MVTSVVVVVFIVVVVVVVVERFTSLEFLAAIVSGVN